MKNTSRNINIHGGVEKLDPNISIPETWAENSNRNIQDSQGKYSLSLKNYCPHFQFTLPTFSLLSCTHKSSDGTKTVEKFDLFSKMFQNTVVIDLKLYNTNMKA